MTIRAKTAKEERVISPCRSRIRLYLGGLALVFGVSVARVNAQVEPVPSGPVATLRVQTNLVQIPVLVLTKEREKLYSPLATNRLVIRLADGPWVRPKFVRLEGADPIDLAILIDPRGPQLDLLPKLSQAIAGLAPLSLSSRDHVSIYVMGCSAMQLVEDLPADAEKLRSAVQIVLKNGTNRVVDGSHARCKPDTRVWDALGYVTRVMSTKPGRRTILAITDGDDLRSKHTPDDLGTLAQADAVTIFGLNPTNHLSGNLGLHSADERLLSVVSEQSGGMTLELEGQSLDKELKRFVQMLRDRYIVEFPRPTGLKPGRVELEVRVTGSDYFIRSAGKSVPFPNPAEVGDGTITVANGGEESASGSVSAMTSEETAPQPQTVSDAILPTANAGAEKPETAAPVIEQALTASNEDSTLPIKTLRVVSKLTVEDVTVTDAKRAPVHGLAKSDFELREDGKPQTIRNFEEFGLERPSTQTPSPALAANTYTNAPASGTAGRAVNILMLDSVTTGLARGLAMSPENIQYARQQSMKYLKNLPAGTEVAILHMRNSVRVIQELTTDKALLIASMNSISYEQVGGAYVSQRGPGAACVAANVQSQLVVDELAQVAAYLSGIQGRKNLIWFTPGIPWLTQYQDFSGVDCLRDYTAQLHKAYALLNAAQVALYPIDPRGLFSDPSYSASADAKANRGVSGQTQPLAAPPVQQAAAFGSGVQGEHNSLREMAEATGGTPYFNRNDLDSVLREAIAAGSDYYSLSYMPPVSGYDGRFHSISVRVARSNLLLQYRTGYMSLDPAKVAPSPESKAQGSVPDSFELALRHGTANSTQLLFDVRVTPSSTARKAEDPPIIGSLSRSLDGKHMVRYDFLYAFSGEEVSLVDQADGSRTGSLELVLAAYDSDGKVLNGLSQTVNFTVTPDELAEFLKRPFQVPIQFDLPAGNVFVRVGVRDVPSEKAGTLEIVENVPKK